MINQIPLLSEVRAGNNKLPETGIISTAIEGFPLPRAAEKSQAILCSI